MNDVAVRRFQEEEHLPIVSNSRPLGEQAISQALHALVATGKTKASGRTIERFITPGVTDNLVTRLLVVTDFQITLS